MFVTLLLLIFSFFYLPKDSNRSTVIEPMVGRPVLKAKATQEKDFSQFSSCGQPRVRNSAFSGLFFTSNQPQPLFSKCEHEKDVQYRSWRN